MRACIQFNDMNDLYFTEPVHVLTADALEDVKSVIEQAERWSMTHYVVGYLNYEAAEAFSAFMAVKETDCYAKFYVFESTVLPFDKPMHQPVKFAFTETRETIEENIRAIKERIRQGDTYQVNYTTRLTAHADVDAYALYCQLTARSNGGYCAFIEDGEHAIISISPELFFKYDRDSRMITTKPMKGTLARHHDTAQDRMNFEQLRHSGKDQAENVMIVDLLRNDLSRIAEKNSVHVPALFSIETYPTVYQMTSVVEAVVEHAKSLYDMLAALFPCGSITGAPKISTMSIIESLEKRRGIYCGTIGILTSDSAIFNVPIRTIEKRGSDMVYGVGGGITIDSDPALEFEEMVMKTRILHQLAPYRDFHLIETMRLDPSGIRRASYHQQRLMRSLQHFGFVYDQTLIDALFREKGEGCYRLAVHDGYISAMKIPLSAVAQAQAVLLPMEETELDWLQHKTSHRSQYQTADGFLALYYNRDNLLTEFNIGNLVYSYNDALYTPAVLGQLPGCMQQELLAANQVTRRDLHIDELAHVDQLWMINSLREWVSVEICKQNMEMF
ncbi:aminodeoxychorismate synthase component I [Macrococcus carouselicus]|uniref:Aminodeoxychorismate synthase component I n=1 Tax=Macrococcus carouselicus TaxID=69969 RepID=A0A9Q8CGU1_9STAP|nr:aminodeoxychorismate synthase component I [Macrococcus carouselicus]TDM03644.1 aminodeoxychorismate synthase component I [Macrococcus carouselicus]